MSNNRSVEAMSLDGYDDDPPESMTFAPEGYDYIFVPPLATGYDCPICLAILREPRQTKCGHRFCRDCILQWLNNKNYCPVDNEPLTKRDIFADVCIKREILCNDIKCPNHEEGCEQLTTISYVQKHLDQCLYSLVPCPLSCPSVVRRRDIDNHVETECMERIVPCPNCREMIKVGLLYDHTTECPKGVIQCDECQADVVRDEMTHHLDCVCKRRVVTCPFRALGCKQDMHRDNEEHHLALESSSHMQMLASSYFTLLENFNSLAVDLSRLDGRNRPSHSEAAISDDESPSARNNASAEGLGNCDSKTLRRNKSLTSSGHMHNERHGLVVSMDRRSMPNKPMSCIELEDDLGVENSYHSLPASTGGHVTTENRNSHNDNSLSHPSLSVSRSVPVLAHSKSYSRSASEISTPDQYLDEPPSGEVSEKTIPEFSSSLYKLCAYQAHMIEKQQAVIANLCNQMNKTEQRLKIFDEQRIAGSVQHSCGDFYWPIRDFSVYREKALKNEETSILHSPPFYSSPWGCKMCLRVNVKSMPNALGEYHLSLFIHFMQGNNDHLLNWPFGGQIVLSIIDQNPIHKDRRHASETLKARSDVAAFQKPTSVRNHKGFGYTDFISLSILDNGNYIVDDTIIVRAQVHPSTE